MEASKQWRVKDAAGVVTVAPTPTKFSDGDWECGDDSGAPFDRSAWDAVARWAKWNGIAAREIAEPGQLFASEQVAAETERCAGHARIAMEREDREAKVRTAHGQPSDMYHWAAAGAEMILERILSGEAVPK